MKKHVSIKVSGTVQGVFYRASTKKKADELNIKGFVRNERNGDVYIEAEGEEKELARFVEWCRTGPPAAVVETVEVAEGPLKGFASFVIER